MSSHSQVDGQDSLKYDRLIARNGEIVVKDVFDSYEGARWVAGTVRNVEKHVITVYVPNGKKKLYRARIDRRTSLCLSRKLVRDATTGIQNLKTGHRVSVAFRKRTDIADRIVDQSYEIANTLSSPTSGSSSGPCMPRCD